MKKNTEQQVVMLLSYPHMLLPTPQFMFVNSELVCFSGGPTHGRELTFHRASSVGRTIMLV